MLRNAVHRLHSKGFLKSATRHAYVFNFEKQNTFDTLNELTFNCGLNPVD